MQTCPKCGHQFEEPDNGLLAPKIARAAIKALGGAEKVGEMAAENLKNAEPGSHRAMIFGSQLRGWVSDADKVNAHTQQNRGIPEEQMKPVLLEYCMQLMETDETFQQKVLRVATKRGLLQPLIENVMPAEYARIDG